MQLNPKPWLILAIVLIFCFVAIGLWRNYLYPRGVHAWDQRFGGFVKPVVFGLFFLFGISVIPLMVNGFIYLQQNTNGSRVEWLQQQGMSIVIVMWVVFAVGLGLPLILMIRQGFFNRIAHH
ncbi:MAG: hypothetical protein H7Y27_06430 [Gemmatimonadaceae bacterium]|nr:hypothetical protein [Chitinophagaceae bacterium]